MRWRDCLNPVSAHLEVVFRVKYPNVIKSLMSPLPIDDLDSKEAVRTVNENINESSRGASCSL